MKRALLILCLAALPVIGQSTNITNIPEDATIFRITLKAGKGPHGNDVVYGAIKDGDAFLETDYEKNDTGVDKNLTIVLDDPANPGEARVFERDVLDAQPEAHQFRLQRYEKAGFVVTEGVDGAKMLVPQETEDRLTRLKELQTAMEAEAEARFSEHEDYATGESEAEQQAGVVSLWGPHILTLLIAGFALFGIVRICFS